MKGRFLVALSLIAALLAGCASPPGTTFDARAAYAAARREVPGMAFLSIEGVEGAAVPQASSLAVFATGDKEGGNGTPSMAFEDDGIDDGPLGDGLLSSWTVQFTSHESLVELRVFADGRPSQRREHALPQFAEDQVGSVPFALDVLDSRRIAAVGVAGAGLAGHHDGTFLYSFTAQTRDYSPRKFLLAEGESPVENLGWSLAAQSWALSWLSPGPQRHVTKAILDGDAKVDSVNTTEPVRRTRPLLADQTFDDLTEARTHEITFEVEEGTLRLSGDLYAQATTAGQVDGVEAPHLRLFDPSGAVRYEGPGQNGRDELSLERIVPGTWTLEVGQETQAPARVHIAAFLWAVVALQ